MGFLKQIQIIFFLFFLSNFVYSQNKLIAYKIEGSVCFLKSKKELYTGSLILEKNSINVKNGNAIFLDENSNMYEVKNNGTISFQEIKQNKIRKTSKSVSKRYLSYVYKKFLKKDTKKSIYGGVFRGKNKLSFPENYSYFKKEAFINFNWRSTGEKEFYLWILNAKNGNIVQKIKVNFSNSISLLLPAKKGIYKWTVTTENSLADNKTFNVFEIVSNKEFDKRKNDRFYEAKKEIKLILE